MNMAHQSQLEYGFDMIKIRFDYICVIVYIVILFSIFACGTDIDEDLEYALDTDNISESGDDVYTTPLADAGESQTVHINTLVMLDGSGSTDEDGDMLTYAWSFKNKPVDSQTVINNPTSVTPTFTPDMIGSYEVFLVVNDGAEESSDNVIISVDIAANELSTLPGGSSIDSDSCFISLVSWNSRFL